ncbi:MAG: KUP/HAK/KT family potassium transporter, partial [Bacteroidota bacterium]
NWDWLRVIATTLVFFTVEGVFFAGNLQKIAHGAGVTLGLMALFLCVMLVNYEAKRIIRHKRRFVDVFKFTDIIKAVSQDKDIPKFATHIVYLTNARQPDRMEKQIIKSIYQKQPKRADVYWLLHFNETDLPFQESYQFREILPGKILRLDFDLGYKVKPNVKEMFTEAVQELAKKGTVDLENRYESLRKYNVPADFLFIVMRNTFNFSSESPFIELFLLNAYNFLQIFSEPPEQYLGMDRNALLVEYIALK